MTGLFGVARGLLLAVLTSLAISACARAGSLIFAFGDHNEAPFAIVQDGRLTGGFALEFGQALAARLGREPVFRFVPRNRISAEIAAGGVDVYCLAALPFYPAFAPDRFTQPLFADQDILLLSAGLRGPAELSSLTGARVGTVLGFLYPPAIEAMFAARAADRIDARNAEGNLRKLLSGRLDAVILPLAAWRLALSRDPALAGGVRPDHISIAVRERTCLVSPSSTIGVPEMDMAIRSLVADGTLPNLIRHMGLDIAGQPADMSPGLPVPARR